MENFLQTIPLKGITFHLTEINLFVGKIIIVETFTRFRASPL